MAALDTAPTPVKKLLRSISGVTYSVRSSEDIFLPPASLTSGSRPIHGATPRDAYNHGTPITHVTNRPIIVGLAATFIGLTALLLVGGVIVSPVLLAVAVPFAVVSYFLWVPRQRPAPRPRPT